jgi:hypothetical protein
MGKKKGHPKVARESFGRGCLKGMLILHCTKNVATAKWTSAIAFFAIENAHILHLAQSSRASLPLANYRDIA